VASFRQIGATSGSNPTLAGPYDVLSLMQYNFRPNWWVVRPGQTNPCLRTVDVHLPSPGDKATLSAAYGAALPPPPSAAPAPTDAVTGTPSAAPAPAATPGAPSAAPTPAIATTSAPTAGPVVMAAPMPRMAFSEAYARLAPAIHTERVRASLTSTANLDSAILEAHTAAGALPHAAQERARATLRLYRAQSVAAKKSSALIKAMDNLESAAAQLNKLKTWQ